MGARFGTEMDVAEEPAPQQVRVAKEEVRVAKGEKEEPTATRSETSPAPSTAPTAPDLFAGRSSRSADQRTNATTSATAVTTTPAIGIAPAVRAGKSNGSAMRLRADAADPTAPPATASARTVVRTDLAARTSAEQFPADIPDGSLLQRFVADREQAAFAALVQRHGGFVLGVCHRVLGDFHAAQDAVQATFLVLARKAGMLDRNGPLGGWLYKVAYHLALRSRAVAARQRLTERTADPGEPIDLPAPDLDEEEVRQALREELQHLPEKYRAPLMLCYFDGRTHADAAREIGLPRGSMAKRIGEGLEHLRERLLVRGFML
jgi:RNA polymerase sigma factor (sigma-70 family)